MIARLLARAPLSPLRCGRSLRHACPPPRQSLYHRPPSGLLQPRGYRAAEVLYRREDWAFVEQAQNGSQNFYQLLASFEEKHVSFGRKPLLECFNILLGMATGERVDALDHNSREMLDRVALSLPNLSVQAVRACLQQSARINLQYRPLHTALIATLTMQASNLKLPSFYGIIMELQKLKLLQEARHFVAMLAERIRMTGDLSTEDAKVAVAYARTVWALSKVQCLPKSMLPDIQAFLESNLTMFNLHSISTILWVFAQHSDKIDDRLLEKVAQHSAKLLREVDTIAPQSVSMLCWVFATVGSYHEEFFQAVSHFICSRLSETQKEPRMYASVAWSCAKVAYYDAALMECIAAYVMDSIEKFAWIDLGNIAFSFGFLNHKCDEVLIKIADRLLSDPNKDSTSQSLGNATWACLIHGIEHKPLLKYYALHSTSHEKQLMGKLQLATFLQAEAPHLGITVSSGTLKRAIVSVLSSHVTMYSVFQTNVTQAVKQLFGGDTSFFTTEAFTRGGYVLDVEVLLDSDGKAIPIPGVLKHPKKLPDMTRTLVSSSETKRKGTLLRSSLTPSPSVDGLIDGMKGSEVDNALSLPSNQLNDVLTNFSPASDSVKTCFLASDWLKSGVPQCARKLAIEADGTFHYASNCHHPLGKTVLKHRQLKALGWEVISIPYYEWGLLKTDDDHVNYLAKKIFP